MTEWRITIENPVRNLNGLDYERCAALHNLIIARGWQQSGRSVSDLDRRTWWDIHVSGGTDLGFLGDDVVACLKTAQAGHLAGQEEICTFHRYLVGLTVPEDLNHNAMYDPDEEDSNKRRCITLYTENSFLLATHPLGLLYDQKSHRAIHVESQDHAWIAENGCQQWLPLEVILQGYLQMMDGGKVKAVGYDYEGDQEVLALHGP